MLTRTEKIRTSEELKENYKRLGMDLDEILRDLEISKEEFENVLNMNYPNPSNVWKVRDYFEYKLNEKGRQMYPFSVLLNHSVNHWYSYDKLWLNKKKEK